MSEGTYEYECMRAELLGIEKPSYDEFIAKKVENEAQLVEEENLDTENLKTVDHQEEGLKKVSGGLEELNVILQKTQGKLNRLKASCGSLTNLLRIKMGGKSSVETPLESEFDQPEESHIEPSLNDHASGDTVEDFDAKEDNKISARKNDLAKALDKDLSRLDTMIEKAENAQYSMSHQRKQMNKFLD
ncbi:uncharacterized protein [Leptinotarsa decemlineata]|uniref:uncharacterized protein n=1 Tax=Leptinotarsa decemlineata TaxID=7539 RepID=UPI003D304210